MNIKKNIVLNAILTVSNYLFPFLTFPYVSRVLGVENIGVCNFVDGIIQYYIFFSMMGISILGIREVAKTKSDSDKLSQTFTSLLIITGANTLIATAVLFISISYIPKFAAYQQMFYIGAAKLIFNFFLIEWFFKGIENFSFITYRSIFIKIIYVVLIFLLVKEHDDYVLYYLLTSGIVILNAIINYYHSRNYVSLNLKNIELKSYMGSYLILGSYILLNSMHSTFNIAYLGFTTSNKEVGLYSTATRIVWIAISFIAPISNVMLPRVSSLLEQNKRKEIYELIDQSQTFLFTICIPLISFLLVFSDQLVELLLGEEYLKTVSIIKICSPLILINGLEQILIIQILMPYKADKEILINSLIGTLVGLLSAIILINFFQAEGSAISWLVSETTILTASIFSVRKKIGTKLFKRQSLKINAIRFSYIITNLLILTLNKSILVTLSTALILNSVHFLILEFYVFKNLLVINFYNNYIKSIKFSI